MSGKIFAGAFGGVSLPIVIEFATKGARIHDAFPYKWSGVVGTITGVFTGILPAVWKEYPLTKDMEKEDKNAVIAFGASSLATGIWILILDELKKRAIYTFRTELPLRQPAARGGLEVLPPEEMIKEI